jgi:hypothetical protein
MSVREPLSALSAHSTSALAAHRFLLRFALAGAGVFAWIFLFQYFYILSGDLSRAFAQAAFLYALTSVVTCLVTPLAARALRTGVRRALLIATLLACAAFVFLGATFEGFWSVSTPSAIAFFAVLLGTYRAMYWTPYEVELHAQPAARRSVFSEMLVALAPGLAGVFIAWSVSASLVLLYLGAGVILLSAIPIFFLRDVHEHFSWNYRETFGELLEPRHRPLLWRSLLEGISGAALIFFWPLAVFLIVGGSYAVLGIALTATFLAAILLRRPVRALIRYAQLHDSRLLTATLAATPWLFRLVIGSPIGVVLVDSYFYTTTPRRFGVDPLVLEQSSDGGSYMDEYTALKEMSLSLGRVLVCMLGAGVALLASVPIAFLAVFLAAAAASVAMALESR